MINWFQNLITLKKYKGRLSEKFLYDFFRILLYQSLIEINNPKIFFQFVKFLFLFPTHLHDMINLMADILVTFRYISSKIIRTRSIISYSIFNYFILLFYAENCIHRVFSEMFLSPTSFFEDYFFFNLWSPMIIHKFQLLLELFLEFSVKVLSFCWKLSLFIGFIFLIRNNLQVALLIIIGDFHTRSIVGSIFNQVVRKFEFKRTIMSSFIHFIFYLIEG